MAILAILRDSYIVTCLYLSRCYGGRRSRSNSSASRLAHLLSSPLLSLISSHRQRAPHTAHAARAAPAARATRTSRTTRAARAARAADASRSARASRAARATHASRSARASRAARATHIVRRCTTAAHCNNRIANKTSPSRGTVVHGSMRASTAGAPPRRSYMSDWHIGYNSSVVS